MKIGDKVRIGNETKSKTPIPLDCIGSEGIIVGIEKEASCCSGEYYWIEIKSLPEKRWFCEGELEVIK